MYDVVKLVMISNTYKYWMLQCLHTRRGNKIYNNVEVEEYLKPLNKRLYREVERNFVRPWILDIANNYYHISQSVYTITLCT